MNKKNLMIVGGVLAVVGIAYYMNTKKKKATSLKLASAPLTDGNMSNASGVNCQCGKGVSGHCASGDCSKCCGSYGEREERPSSRFSANSRMMRQSNRMSN